MKTYWTTSIVIALLLILVGGGALYMKYASLGDPTPSASPVTSTPTATTTGAVLWDTFTDQAAGVSFQYPTPFPYTFISAPSWPPKILMATGTLVCKEALEDRGETTAKRTIAGRSYCVTEESEGAAGSIYTTYTYRTAKGGKVISADFTLRAVQCANYDDPKKTACGEEREAFDPDSLVDRIVVSATTTLVR